MKHTIYFNAAQNMSPLKDKSVDIVVTSPPYPMIEMWDNIMSNQNPDIKSAFEANEPRKAFELMHQELDKVWAECWRVLKEGSFLCINIGDATRTINGEFALYNNNARIIQACEKLGFINLPNILWRKTTNAPNKFMGSGMLPCGAYVTLEHEWILIFRKGGKRVYKKCNRWSCSDFKKALNHPETIKAFQKDFQAMQEADFCVLLLPCGRSAHSEAGWMKGNGKKVFILDLSENPKPELMYRMYDDYLTETMELIERIKLI